MVSSWQPFPDKSSVPVLTLSFLSFRLCGFPSDIAESSEHSLSARLKNMSLLKNSKKLCQLGATTRKMSTGADLVLVDVNSKTGIFHFYELYLRGSCQAIGTIVRHRLANLDD